MCFMNMKVNNVTEKYWKNNLIVLVEQLNSVIENKWTLKNKSWWNIP